MGGVHVAAAAEAEGILAIYAPSMRETAISFELKPPSVEAEGLSLAGCFAKTSEVSGARALEDGYNGSDETRAGYETSFGNCGRRRWYSGDLRSHRAGDGDLV